MVHIFEDDLSDLWDGLINKGKQVKKIFLPQALLPEEKLQNIPRTFYNTSLCGVFIDVVDNLIFEHPFDIIFLFVIGYGVSIEIVGP